MPNDTAPANLPPSGPWTGYYIYDWAQAKHRMQLRLTFSPSGQIDGDGVDDVGDFLVHGVFEPNTLKATWTKAYVGMHSVEYRGIYDHKRITGSWRLAFTTGEFQIWPGASEQGEQETAYADVEDPELVLV